MQVIQLVLEIVEVGPGEVGQKETRGFGGTVLDVFQRARNKVVVLRFPRGNRERRGWQRFRDRCPVGRSADAGNRRRGRGGTDATRWELSE